MLVVLTQPPGGVTVVAAWYNRRGFLRATARAVAEALAALPDGGEGAQNCTRRRACRASTSGAR